MPRRCTKYPPALCLYCLIRLHPGCRISELARLLRVPYYIVYSRLVTLEGAGILLAEDDRGHIYPADAVLWRSDCS